MHKTGKISKKSPSEIAFDSAQDKQDEIFKQMSAERKVELAGQFWRLARELSSQNTDYDKQPRSKTISRQSGPAAE